MKNRFLFFFLIILFVSCQHNSIESAKVVFSIKAFCNVAAAESSEKYEVNIKLAGDLDLEQSVDFQPGKTANCAFENLPIGKKTYAIVNVSQNEKLLFSGQSEEIVIKEGENKLIVKLKRAKPDEGEAEPGSESDPEGEGEGETETNPEEEQEPEPLSYDGAGIIVIPLNGLNIQIDQEKSMANYYLNYFDISLKATDINNNPIEEGIKWTASVRYHGTEINSANKTYYTVNSATGRVSSAIDPQTHFPAELGILGTYQLYVTAEYNGEKSSAFFEIPVENRYFFEMPMGNEDFTSTFDYILANNNIYNIYFKFTGSVAEEGAYSIAAASSDIYTVFEEEEDAPIVFYIMDFSDVKDASEIEEETFRGFTKVTKIILPDCGTTIGQYAFEDCTKLESVIIPDGVTVIPEGCFYGCSVISSIELPANVTEIGRNAFYDCKELTSINIPSGLTEISEACFYGCKALSEIILPDNITSIGASAFYNCYNLESINIPSGITSFGSSAFCSCEKLTSFTIPSGVTVIPNSCFEGCIVLADFELPSWITEIGRSAFSSCESLESVTLPNGLTSISSSSFYNCDSLTQITIPASVTQIEGSAFCDCDNLTTVIFEENSQLKAIYGAAFMADDRLTDIGTAASLSQEPKINTLPATLRFIDLQAFEDANFSEITLPADNNLSAIGGTAFTGCYLYNIKGTWKYLNPYKYDAWNSIEEGVLAGEIPTVSASTRDVSISTTTEDSIRYIYYNGSNYYFKY